MVTGGSIIMPMLIMMAALAVLAVIAGADYALQRFRFMQRNRMSRHQVKEEFRQSECDPAVKAKVKQICTERVRKRMMATIPGATVIITNPTHFAIALKYESGKIVAPVCVAKGVDSLALRIRELAEEHEVRLSKTRHSPACSTQPSNSTGRFRRSITRPWRRSSVTSCGLPASCGRTDPKSDRLAP